MKLRSALGVLVTFTAALLVVLLTGMTALAKEGITARLTAPLDLRSHSGERIAVDWTVAGHDDQGRQQPFNAVGVFVRLFSASGGPSTIGFASPTEHADGRYDAQVTVPPGGIGGIEIGLRGSSDTIFPLENDPISSAPSSRTSKLERVRYRRVVLGRAWIGRANPT